jgi:hypothetical protein
MEGRLGMDLLRALLLQQTVKVVLVVLVVLAELVMEGLLPGVLVVPAPQ